MTKYEIGPDGLDYYLASDVDERDARIRLFLADLLVCEEQPRCASCRKCLEMIEEELGRGQSNDR